MEFSAAQQVKIRKSRKKKKKKKRWKSLFIDVLCAPDFVSQRPGLFLILFLHFVGVCYVFLTYIVAQSPNQTNLLGSSTHFGFFFFKKKGEGESGKLNFFFKRRESIN